MTPEEYFFRYAFPCTEDLLNRKWIKQETFDRFTRIAHGLVLGENPAPARQELEATYKNAVRRMKSIAEKEKKDYWSMDIVKKYFFEGHNACIDRGEDHFAKETETFKDFCKTHEADVVGFVQTVGMRYDGKERPVDVYRVRYDGKEKLAFNFYNLDNLEGKVRIHYAFIIEKV